MRCCLNCRSKWVSGFLIAINSGLRAFGCHYSANTLEPHGEYATGYEIKLHALLIGTIDR